MRFFSTLRSRLLLTFFGLLLLGFSGLTLLAGQQMAENIYNSGLKDLESHSLQLSSILHEVIEESAQPILNSFCMRMGLRLARLYWMSRKKFYLIIRNRCPA